MRVGFIGFDGVTALDLVGPIETFSTAAIRNKDGSRNACYDVGLVGLTSQPFTAESGITFKPRWTLATVPDLDTLIIPGGKGLRLATINAAVSGWITMRHKEIRRIASVCTGIYGLAATGLLDGREVTTHWRFAADVAARFPKLKLEPNALFHKDGPFFTSAGVTAGIDLALAMIEEDFGAHVALSVARELVVYLKRPGGQEQYSEPLQFQTKSAGRFADLVAWMTNSLGQDLSVSALAHRACLSPRHFVRRFKEVFGQPPARFVEAIRLNEARRRLCAADTSIELLAESVGFKSSDAFRRAFERKFQVTPSKYRRGFGVQNKNRAVSISQSSAPAASTVLASRNYFRSTTITRS